MTIFTGRIYDVSWDEKDDYNKFNTEGRMRVRFSDGATLGVSMTAYGVLSVMRATQNDPINTEVVFQIDLATEYLTAIARVNWYRRLYK